MVGPPITIIILLHDAIGTWGAAIPSECFDALGFGLADEPFNPD